MTNSSSPFFSIIIPTFNSEATIAKTLESIVTQTCKEYEVLIVDGLSSDTTLHIIASYKEQLPTLHLRSEPDHGIYDAMNKGIAQAKGAWLYFLGSDDHFYDPHVLQHVFNFVDATDLDIVYGDVFSELHHSRYAGVFNYETLTRQNICHQALFFKRRIFDITGLFKLKYKTAADWDHNITWFLNSKIKHGYVHLIIAFFAKGGHSHLYEDYPFEGAKHFKFLRLGYFKLPFGTLKRLCKLEISKARANNNLLTLFILQIYYLSLRFRRKFKFFKTTP